MAESGSTLSPLSLTHDLWLGCTECCIKKNEITFSLKNDEHKCDRNFLLCKTKGGTIWRPVSPRPTFPTPRVYEVCWHFKEGRGCTVHGNRCTFARSTEEAAVWMFEKQHGFTHQLLCNRLTPPDRLPQQPLKTLQELIAEIELKVVCDLCVIRVKDITYKLQSVVHKCSRKLLLAKGKASEVWRPVSERPTGGHMGPNVHYKVCNFYVEGSGCPQHVEGRGCSFARTNEEATVWNYTREKQILHADLLRLVSESEGTSSTPEIAAKKILQQFSGEFLELCKDCFRARPQMLAKKRWSTFCSADASHPWDPVLVHHPPKTDTKCVYSQVRPLPPNCQFKYCGHIREGKPCWHQPGHCRSAQSEVEMAVWKAEHSGLDVRPHLLQLSGSNSAKSKEVTMFCKVCLLEMTSPESFYQHCSSQEHAQLLAHNTTTRWTKRRPPHSRRAEFWLCDRPQTCEYGHNCPKAHSEEELKEWMMRAAEEREIRNTMETEGFVSYNQRLLEEYTQSSNEEYIMSEQVDDVSICCDKDLTVELENMDEPLRWTFKVETERQLQHVALLKQEPGAAFSLSDSSSMFYSPGNRFCTEDMCFNITVSFTCSHPGLYVQWLVLDFDMRPVLVRKLKVRVGLLSFDDDDPPSWNPGAMFQRTERWNRDNRVIIPCSSRTEEEEKLSKEYKLPQMNSFRKYSQTKQPLLNDKNYREWMHQFLYAEEQARSQIVSRLNICGKITTMAILMSPKFGMEFALQGELFGVISVPCKLTVDSPEGLVLKQSIHSVLMGPVNTNHPQAKVYEASILPGKTNESQIHLRLSKQCCSDLALKKNETYKMEVQFQLDCYSFGIWHKAADLLPDTTRVLPNFGNCGVPVGNVTFEKLNPKQQSAVDFILGDCNGKKFVAPLLIYGPFGTGKTFTLATATRELCKNRQNKVLICTYTNSSADLYIRDHFHPIISNEKEGLRPLRIKANKQGKALKITHEITLKYCLLSKDKQQFLLPTKDALDAHNVVVTTTSMAKHFHDLKLPEGYFTHILIDEASQMLECEALLALNLAGSNTRVALAGDHMQMGPQLFSVDDDRRSEYTLLTRLFHYYQGKHCDAAQRSRVIFSDNYRSTKEIVDFVSTHFYVGKMNAIKAAGNVPPPANNHALRFHHVRGDCVLDTISKSWWNKQEILEVENVVKDILEQWPSTWGPKEQRSICVLSEGAQVWRIRKKLSKTFPDITVETLANVQGGQFRAVIMTAVQTRDSLQSSHVPGLPLFSDARVLNTAMTRAKSHIVVVGDAAALSTFGKCSGIWKSFIDHCISNNSVGPQHYTKDFFERDVMETVRFQRCEDVSDNHILNDAILKELKDEYEQQQTEYSSDEESSEPQNIPSDVNGLIELCETQPRKYKQGKFFREAYNRGHVKLLNNTGKQISIVGQANMRQAFTGDEVVVQIEREEQNSTNGGKVVGIIRKDENARQLVCHLEEEDHTKRTMGSISKFVKRTMIPVDKRAPKICICINKKRRNFIPVWERSDGTWTFAHTQHSKEVRDCVFVVQILDWKKQCLNPIGRVIDILPERGPFDDRLWLLKKEFGVAAPSYKSFELTEEDVTERRVDLRRKITFTVDPPDAKDLDDAISIKDLGDIYELGVHISDVASFVRANSHLDRYAEKRGSTYYNRGQKPTHMFPEKLSTGHFSLLSGQDSRVISLMFKVEKETHKIIDEPTFQLSLISSNRQLSYEEAEKIITENYMEGSRFDTVEDCLTVAYCFAKTQRRARLEDWAYSQSDDDRVPGRRKARLMIEELSVLYNKHASEYLTDSMKTRLYTPLRCQQEPDLEKVEKFKENCKHLIPFSFHVNPKVKIDEPTNSLEGFQVLTKVWTDIQAAAKENDLDKMVDLVAADDIHPQLQKVINQFKRCSNKAYVIRSNSSPQAMVGHYSLNIKNYTQASSPIRRYMDIILQRLLHCVICNKTNQYTRAQITDMCSQFQENLTKARVYEQKAEELAFTVSTRHQNPPKLAIIVHTDEDGDGFEVMFPFNRSVFQRSMPIRYADLQLEDQPLFNDADHSVTLKWKKRICIAESSKVQLNLNTTPDCGPCVKIPLKAWRDAMEAIGNQDLDRAKSLLLEVNTQPWDNPMPLPPTPPVSKSTNCFSPEKQEVSKKLSDSWKNVDLHLKPGDRLQIQMTSEKRRGFHTPTIQLVHIKQHFEICIDHIHRPVECFSKPSRDKSNIFYNNVNQYKEIWKPLCEMESASTAVDDCESVIIENLEIRFSQTQKDKLIGTFFLPELWTREFEFSLGHCFLCIRKRNLELTTTSEFSTQVDPTQFTWVAHGVTSKVEEKQEGKVKTGSNVDFYINHLPMENIPDSIFQRNTCFTVEIIPKLLPDIRKDGAVVSLGKACDLVKNIILRKRIKKEVVQSDMLRWKVKKRKLLGDLPELNDSQIQAVTTAIKEPFTLIQGPPGTGKTVVGVYIVHWFFQMNSETPRIFDDPKDEHRKKKEVILYCGPSNKSVDVVAEYLMKVKGNLRLLRVYSHQVEMLDYPHPDSILQFSKTLRQDRSKPELRSITLHHLMREPSNPHADDIKKFDERIRQNDDFTQREIKECKDLLNKARVHELERHDIILCTCTQSSTPSLIRSVSARQILIDECAMATEPQALIPLVCNKPEKVVLIGDHKQLRPIVKNPNVKKLGMSRSLFESYFNQIHQNKAVMLDTQYRMHEEICKFPSEKFYEGKLKTEGKTIKQVVKTAKGNTNSKANYEERDQVVEIVKMLVYKAKVEKRSIVVLSPYNAQASEIRKELKESCLGQITVTTITESQGSEWRYVILSTVCSLPSEEIPAQPDGAWFSEHIGFVGDPNQINVGITRAKEGLCIIGNQKLLECSWMWRDLLAHYRRHNAVTEANKISIKRRI
uniref:C3H1-type domain-containing protein n=1 Tax=Oryzias melastigma TaxID=30732 RepID=A0A3B3B4C7_ORYME